MNTTTEWLIYTRHCPRCQQGLCRVRICTDSAAPSYFLLCDECDAVWSDPNEMHITPQADASNPTCPNSDIAVWSPSTRWADLQETIHAGWFGHVYVQRNRTDC